MKHLFLLIVVLTLIACSSNSETVEAEMPPALVALISEYAPDRRTDRVEIVRTGDTISGYTTVSAAKEALDRQLAENGMINKVRLLPDSAVGIHSVGLVKVSVANLRSKPGHSQELATQALYGTPIEVLDYSSGWYLVRTPDRYIGWLEPGAFTRLTRPDLRAYLDGRIERYDPAGFGIQKQPDPNTSEPAIRLTDEVLLRLTGERQDQWWQVMLPDSTTGYVATRYLDHGKGNYEPDSLSISALLHTADKFRDRPYLWGGTSPAAMDCSGFTKMTYYLNGYVIPRDASQQVHAGVEVELTDDLGNLIAGDLLFFGSLRADGSQRITHVGFYLGEGRMLHAGADNGRITENNLIEGRPSYNEARRRTLLRAKRLRPGSPGVMTIKDAFEAV